MTNICLGRNTSSISRKKSGTLELFDAAILRLIKEHAPDLYARHLLSCQQNDEEDESATTAEIRRCSLYNVLLATGICR